MGVMTRRLPLAFLLGVVGCAGTPRPEPARAPATEVVTPAVEPAKPEPKLATALPVVELEMAPRLSFARARIRAVAARKADDKALAASLPPALRPQFEQALRATERLAKVAEPLYTARFESLSCEPDKCAQAEKKLDLVRKTVDREATRIRGAHRKTTDALSKLLEKSPSAELALAVARLEEEDARQADIETENHPAELSFEYGEFAPGSAGNPAAVEALRAGKQHAGPDSALGQKVRYSLMTHLWESGDAEGALEEVEALLPVAPADMRYELEGRRALLIGARGDHVAASAAFARALALPETPGEPFSRSELRSARVLAEYRAGRFESALDLALRELDHAPPARALFAAFDTGPELVVALDCIERLGKDPLSSSASAPTRARLAARLALRALHRHDKKRAEEMASAAIELAEQQAGDAFDVLAALAEQKGDVARAAELRERKGKARSVSSEVQLGMLAMLGMGKSEPEYEERNSLSSEAPASAKRNLASLLRLCLEPIHWKLPKRQASANVRLDVTVKDDGSVVIDDQSTLVPELDGCLRTMAPKLLARSPSSVHARVDLSKLDETFLSGGGSVADVLAQAGGLGGLDLAAAGRAGGGGSTAAGAGGGGIGGLGGIGTRAGGSGIGGLGRGSSLRGSGKAPSKPRSKAAPPKRAPVPAPAPKAKNPP